MTYRAVSQLADSWACEPRSRTSVLPMPFASCNGVASAAALLLRCQVLHHPAKVDNSRAQLVDGGVPIFHARLPVRELLRQFLVVCVGVDFLLDLLAHIREGQLSRRRGAAGVRRALLAIGLEVLPIGVRMHA